MAIKKRSKKKTTKKSLGIKKSSKKKSSSKKKRSEPKPLPPGKVKGDIDTETYQSPSSIEMYLKCPKQWEFRYVRGYKMPPSIAMHEGSSHHTALDHNNQHKIKKGKDRSSRKLVEVFSDDLKSRTKNLDRDSWEGETYNSVQKRGVELIKTYLAEHASTIKPIAAEDHFKSETIVKGVRVGGFIDLETKTTVYDYKVVGKHRSERDARQSMQLGIYAAAKKKRKVGFITFNKKTLTIQKTKVTPLPAMTVAAIIKSIQESIRKGAFPMTSPANFLCNKLYCGYWHLCRGKYGG